YGKGVFAQSVPEAPEVIFNDGPGASLTELLQDNINDVLKAVNTTYTRQTSFEENLTRNIFNGEDGAFGLNEFRELLDVTKFYVSEEVQTGSIYDLINGDYEVRSIFVELDVEVEKEKDKVQELILSFNPEGTLYGARFALPQERFDQILNDSRSFEDEFRRMQIVNYLERFRTAYNRKDVEFIEQQFSEQALIITGTRIEPTDDNLLEENISEEQYRFLRQTRDEYIARLKNEIFKQNEFINVEFDDIDIVKHPYYEEVYGINLFQLWDSSVYSDEGYLFLMIDYEDETKPVIYVRAWQPEPFEDGSVIDIEMFNLIK
ncbi:MAG: hypothetical protein WD139_02655, partial [Balneolaceae bacterium]